MTRRDKGQRNRLHHGDRRRHDDHRRDTISVILIAARVVSRSPRYKPPSQTMGHAERVKLLDAAMRSSAPHAFLDGVRSAFEFAGRHDDALIVTLVRSLLKAGEIETVMNMRARWVRLLSAVSQN